GFAGASPAKPQAANPSVVSHHAALRLRVPEEAGIPLAHLEAGVPRVADGPATDDAARWRHRVRRPPRVHTRRRLPVPRLEPLRPPRRTPAQAVPGGGRPARLLSARLLAEYGV